MSPVHGARENGAAQATCLSGGERLVKKIQRRCHPVRTATVPARLGCPFRRRRRGPPARHRPSRICRSQLPEASTSHRVAADRSLSRACRRGDREVRSRTSEHTCPTPALHVCSPGAPSRVVPIGRGITGAAVTGFPADREHIFATAEKGLEDGDLLSIRCNLRGTRSGRYRLHPDTVNLLAVARSRLSRAFSPRSWSSSASASPKASGESPASTAGIVARRMTSE